MTRKRSRPGRIVRRKKYSHDFKHFYFACAKKDIYRKVKKKARPDTQALFVLRPIPYAPRPIKR